jgi:hypothetical protein
MHTEYVTPEIGPEILPLGTMSKDEFMITRPVSNNPNSKRLRAVDGSGVLIYRGKIIDLGAESNKIYKKSGASINRQ